MKTKRPSLNILNWFTGLIIIASTFSAGAFADTRGITEVGRNDACQLREVALKLAHTDAVNNANKTCAALGDNWRYDKELFSGYEQCTPCGSSGEYKCKVTQAKFVCKTKKN